MALLKIGKGSSDHLVTLRDDLRDVLKPTAATFANVSVESFHQFNADPKAAAAAVANIGEVADQLSTAFTTAFEHMSPSAAGSNVDGSLKSNSGNGVAGFGGKRINEQQLAAASLIALATRDPKSALAYASAAQNCDVMRENGVRVIEPSGNPALNYSTESLKPSFEAFDARNLEELRAFNVMFAFSAAIQDEFAEGFFRTVTLSPDSTGLEVSIRRTMIQAEIRHPQTGEVVDWKQKNLLDALSDPTIIINEATRIFPRVIVGNVKSEQHFVDKTIIAPQETLANGGTKIFTAPLKAGIKINLVGAGTNDRTNGQHDQTDAIDHAVKVEALYYRIVTSSGTSIVKFNTKQFAYNSFLKSFEGRDRRISLDFPTHGLLLNSATVDAVTGAPATALTFLGSAPYENVQLNLDTHVTGEGNLQFGYIQVNTSNTEVATARVVNGPHDYDEITDETTLADIRGQFTKIEFLGYDVKAYYANSNKRYLGLLVDSVEERVRYVVPLSPPISVQTPITGTATATEMAGPMNAQRIVNSINAVTKLLETRDTLREIVGQIGYRSPTDQAPEIEGFARLMVRPYLFDETLNIANVLMNTSSANRLQDVQAAIVNKIRFGITSAYTESRYQPALDSINGTAGERPKVVIGTDPTVASYIMVNGDPRILGLGFETQVVVTYDVRMRGKIAATFVRGNVSDVDILSFGNLAYIPELVTQAQLNFQGSTTNVTQVQNRNLHVVFLPILVWIEVEGLEQAVSDQVAFPVAF
jgi:hypothetical protein